MSSQVALWAVSTKAMDTHSRTGDSLTTPARCTLLIARGGIPKRLEPLIHINNLLPNAVDEHDFSTLREGDISKSMT